MRASTNNKKMEHTRVSLLASRTSLAQKESAGSAAALFTPPFTSSLTYLALAADAAIPTLPASCKYCGKSTYTYLFLYSN